MRRELGAEKARGAMKNESLSHRAEVLDRDKRSIDETQAWGSGDLSPLDWETGAMTETYLGRGAE